MILIPLDTCSLEWYVTVLFQSNLELINTTLNIYKYNPIAQ